MLLAATAGNMTCFLPFFPRCMPDKQSGIVRKTLEID